MFENFDLNFLIGRSEAVFRSAVPILAAAMAGILSERSGVINIALEGGLLMAAFAAGAVGHLAGVPLVGLLAAVAMGMIYSSLYAASVVRFRADAIVTGTGFNLLALSLTPVLSIALYGSQSGTPALAPDEKFGELFAGQYALGLAVFVLPFALFYCFRFTPFGLRLRGAGENPSMLRSLGVSVAKVRFFTALLWGACLGVGGAYLALCVNSGFSRNMSAGMGFLGLAALICGGWRPMRALAFCMLFATVDVLQTELSQIEFAFGRVPNAFAQSLPYIIGLAVLIVVGQKTGAPRALGEP